MNPGAYTILIIIPCLNEQHNLEPLITALIRDTQDIAALIVIADGGSADQTPQIAQRLSNAHPNIVALDNPKRIQGAAVNLAVATYGKEAELLIRLDAHADYPPGYCRSLIEEAHKTQAASIVVTMRTEGKGGFQDAVAEAQNSMLGNGGSSHRNRLTQGRWVEHGHHALMRISAFQAVGGYDENFSHNEDAELDMRLRKAGFSIWLTANTSLVYYPRATAMSLFKQYFKYGRGRFHTISKHRVLPGIRQLLPLAIAPVVMIGFLGAPLSWAMAAPLMVWITLALGYGIIAAAQKRNPTLALSGVAILIMHFAWSLGFWKGAWDASKAGYHE